MQGDSPDRKLFGAGLPEQLERHDMAIDGLLEGADQKFERERQQISGFARSRRRYSRGADEDEVSIEVLGLPQDHQHSL